MPEMPPPPPSPAEGDKATGHNEAPAAPPKIVVPPPPPPLPQQASPVEGESPRQESGWAGEGRSEPSTWSAWLVSFLVHAIGLFLLGLITLHAQRGGGGLSLLGGGGGGTGEEAATGDFDEQGVTIEAGSPDATSDVSRPEVTAVEAAPIDAAIEVPKLVRPAQKAVVAKGSQVPASSDRANKKDRGTGGGTGGGVGGGNGPGVGKGTGPNGGWGGRDPKGRGRLAFGNGGTRQSEEAVERGLRWLAAHQRDDGSWSFDLSKPPCNGFCRNSGTEASSTAATGLALLPFLGAGYTHKLESEYREVVKRGLYYLSTRAIVSPQGVDLRDGGSMYAHGIAAIAVCEAYGMTQDAALREIADGATRFVVKAQDLQGGGWRYGPGEPGDTTVTGWQLMCLKSAQMANIEVPSPAIGLAQRFLDSVQYDRGARYGYLNSTPRAPTHEATTAVGLLLRMYTGWNRNRQSLYRGVTYLHKWGPSKTNLYYDYYATQVLHHFQGPEWQAWNKVMRDYLIAHQARESHEAGSWYFPDPYGDRGGRLYNTAMAIMILEVYYRHMPLYGDKAVHDHF